MQINLFSALLMAPPQTGICVQIGLQALLLSVG
jgi:hypothetical protein